MFNDEEHLENLLRWLIDEVMSAGGDGDAIWHSKYRTIDELLPFVAKINKELNLKWTIKINETPDGNAYLSWHNGQEALIITNSKKMWDNRPSWQQCSIDW
jgi:hypothetical protein